MKSPPRKAPGTGKQTGRKWTLIAYRALAFVQAPFGFVFWRIEQRKARLQDKLEQRGALR